MDYTDPYHVLDSYSFQPQSTPSKYYQTPFDPAILLGYTPVSVEIHQGQLYLDAQLFGSIDDLMAGY